MAVVRVRIEADAQKFQTAADAFAHGRRVFTDPSGKHQGIEATERGCKAADPFLCLVAKKRQRLGGARIVRLAIEQIPNVAAGLRNSKQSRLVIHHGAKLRGRHRFRRRQIAHEPRVEIPRAGAHGQTRRRRECHARVDAAAVLHGREAGAAAQVRKNDPPSRRGGIAGTPQLLHQKRIGQAMKAIALHSLRRVAPRNRQPGGNQRHAPVKRRIEAHDLRQLAISSAQRLYQLDLARQVFRIVWND